MSQEHDDKGAIPKDTHDEDDSEDDRHQVRLNPLSIWRVSRNIAGGVIAGDVKAVTHVLHRLHQPVISGCAPVQSLKQKPIMYFWLRRRYNAGTLMKDE